MPSFLAIARPVCPHDGGENLARRANAEERPDLRRIQDPWDFYRHPELRRCRDWVARRIAARDGEPEKNC